MNFNIKYLSIHHMYYLKVIFIIMSLLFIFMAIKAHANIIAQQVTSKKKQQQREKAPLYYRVATQ